MKTSKSTNFQPADSKSQRDVSSNSKYGYKDSFFKKNNNKISSGGLYKHNVFHIQNNSKKNSNKKEQSRYSSNNQLPSLRMQDNGTSQRLNTDNSNVSEVGMPYFLDQQQGSTKRPTPRSNSRNVRLITNESTSSLPGINKRIISSLRTRANESNISDSSRLQSQNKSMNKFYEQIKAKQKAYNQQHLTRIADNFDKSISLLDENFAAMDDSIIIPQEQLNLKNVTKIKLLPYICNENPGHIEMYDDDQTDIIVLKEEIPNNIFLNGRKVAFEINQENRYFPLNLSCGFDKKYDKFPIKWYINLGKTIPDKYAHDLKIKGPVIHLTEESFMDYKKNFKDKYATTKRSVENSRKNTNIDELHNNDEKGDKKHSKFANIINKIVFPGKEPILEFKKAVITIKLSTKIPKLVLNYSFTNNIIRNNATTKTTTDPFEDPSISDLLLSTNRNSSVTKKNLDYISFNAQSAKLFTISKNIQLNNLKLHYQSKIENVIDKGKERKKQIIDKRVLDLRNFELKNVKAQLYKSFLEKKSFQSQNQQFFCMIIITYLYMFKIRNVIEEARFEENVFNMMKYKLLICVKKMKGILKQIPSDNNLKTVLTVRNGLFLGMQIGIVENTKKKASKMVGIGLNKFCQILKLRNTFLQFSLYIKNLQRNFKKHIILKKHYIESQNEQWDKDILNLIELNRRGFINNFHVDITQVDKALRDTVIKQIFETNICAFIVNTLKESRQRSILKKPIMKNISKFSVSKNCMKNNNDKEHNNVQGQSNNFDKKTQEIFLAQRDLKSNFYSEQRIMKDSSFVDRKLSDGVNPRQFMSDEKNQISFFKNTHNMRNKLESIDSNYSDNDYQNYAEVINTPISVYGGPEIYKSPGQFINDNLAEESYKFTLDQKEKQLLNDSNAYSPTFFVQKNLEFDVDSKNSESLLRKNSNQKFMKRNNDFSNFSNCVKATNLSKNLPSLRFNAYNLLKLLSTSRENVIIENAKEMIAKTKLDKIIETVLFEDVKNQPSPLKKQKSTVINQNISEVDATPKKVSNTPKNVSNTPRNVSNTPRNVSNTPNLKKELQKSKTKKIKPQYSIKALKESQNENSTIKINERPNLKFVKEFKKNKQLMVFVKKFSQRKKFTPDLNPGFMRAIIQASVEFAKLENEVQGESSLDSNN